MRLPSLVLTVYTQIMIAILFIVVFDGDPYLLHTVKNMSQLIGIIQGLLYVPISAGHFFQ